MTSILKSNTFISRILVMSLVMVIIAISCTKSNDTKTNNNAVKYCKTISWTDTAGRTGSFTGTLINGQYELTNVTFSEDGKTPTSISFTYDSSGHLNTRPGLTVTYNQGILVNYIVDLSYVSSATGTETFTFNTSGQLTNVSAEGNNQNGPVSLSSDYTYDSNGDPVHIVGHGSQITANQVEKDDYDVTLSYFEDKDAFIAYIPIAAPFSVFFNTYGSVLSKHLINQMSVTQSTTLGSESEVFSYSPYYLYTYDTNGRVVSMKKTVPIPITATVFTFTYTGCN